MQKIVNANVIRILHVNVLYSAWGRGKWENWEESLDQADSQWIIYFTLQIWIADSQG